MSPVPAQPKIYHITHVDNLAAIVREGVLLSEATMLATGWAERHHWYVGDQEAAS